MERGRIQGLPKFLGTPIISEMGKATHFKFGGCIYRTNQNRNPLKFWKKMERGRIQGLPKFFWYPLLSQEPVKLWTSNFVYEHSRDRSEQKPMKNVPDYAVGVFRESRKYFGHPCIGRIARSSLR